MRRVAREAAIFALFLLLSIALTWPLAIRLDTAVADLGDPLLNVWIVDWVCHALTHAPLDLYNAPIYHTGLYPLAYSENLVGIALVVLPFHLAGLSAIAVYNIAMLLGFAFSAYGAFVLARLVTGSTAGALVGAIFFAFGSFKFAHLAHLQILWSGWLPLLLAALLVYWRRPSRRHAVLLCGAFLMNGLTNIHWLLFGGFALGVTVVFLHVAEPRRERRFWVQLAAALLIAGLLLLPFLIPYQIVAKEYGARRTTAEARLGSASWTDWLIAWTHNRVYGPVPAPELRRAERQLFPGLLILFLAAVPFVLRRRSRNEHSSAVRRALRSSVLTPMGSRRVAGGRRLLPTPGHTVPPDVRPGKGRRVWPRRWIASATAPRSWWGGMRDSGGRQKAADPRLPSVTPSGSMRQDLRLRWRTRRTWGTPRDRLHASRVMDRV